MGSRAIVNCAVLSWMNLTRRHVLPEYIVDAIVHYGALTRRVVRAFHARRAQAHTSDFESTTSRLMSFPLEEDVDASQVRTFLEGSLCMLTLQQPVIYIPCDETGMGAINTLGRLSYIINI